MSCSEFNLEVNKINSNEKKFNIFFSEKKLDRTGFVCEKKENKINDDILHKSN